MNSPLMSLKEGGEMVYRWPPAPAPAELVVPRVSQVLDVIARPEYQRMALDAAATYAVDEVLYWSEELPRAAAIAKIKQEATARRDAAGRRGTKIHNAVDTILKGEEAEDVDPDHLPYIAQAVRFLDDWMLKPLHSEQTVYSRTYQYAGTADLIAEVRTYGNVPIDWKSGRPKDANAIQLSAYANGDFIGTRDGDMYDVPECEVGIAVYLNPEADTYDARIVDVTPTARPFKTFVAARSILRWLDEYANGALPKLPKEETAQTA